MYFIFHSVEYIFTPTIETINLLYLAFQDRDSVVTVIKSVESGARMQKYLVCPQIRLRELFAKMLQRLLSRLKETSGCCVIHSACFVIILAPKQMVTHFINCPLVVVFFLDR